MTNVSSGMRPSVQSMYGQATIVGVLCTHDDAHRLCGLFTQNLIQLTSIFVGIEVFKIRFNTSPPIESADSQRLAN